jgi:RNA polymerase sigma-70 factor (ECF subfamily)
VSEIRQLEDEISPLLAGARAGSTADLSRLLQRCHQTVYRWALVHTGDPDDADDVTQEVLVRLGGGLDRYHGRSAFTTWLYQVTRNAAYDLKRRLASRLRRLTLWEPQQSRVEEPGDRLDSESLTSVVTRLFRTLPPREREVFHLADLEGLSAGEIAERLGIRPVTVRVNLLNARRKIRSLILAEHPEFAEERAR